MINKKLEYLFGTLFLIAFGAILIWLFANHTSKMIELTKEHNEYLKSQKNKFVIKDYDISIINDTLILKLK